MACYKPIAAYRSRDGDVGFKHLEDSYDIQLPCGQCIGCRLEKSRQWAVRMTHEAQMHEFEGGNAFLTLTYSDEHLPSDVSVNVQHFQSFMKKLRARLAPKRIRFFHCGEYGDDTDPDTGEVSGFLGRPHYHAIIFGFSFPDRTYFDTVNGCRYYRSAFLEDVWDSGFAIVGDVTFESCAYVARYVVKKMNGELAHDHYFSLDDRTGELKPVSPEYCTMSRRPGIGASWFAEFGTEVVHSDSVYLRGHEMKPPRFYDGLYDSLELEAVKGERDVASRLHDSDNTPDRLRVREVVKQAQISFLKRGYEHAS